MTDTTDEVLVRSTYVPDILDVIAALSSDAVPTPPVLARALLDLLPDDVWGNPEYKWLDPATKSGSILREVARRLMDGLTEWEPNPDKRAEHILRNMLYGCGVTQVHAEMTRRSVYVSRDASGPHSIVTFDDDEGNIPFVLADHEYPTKKGQQGGSCTICGAPYGLERGPNRENYAYAFIHGAYPTEEMKDMQFDVIVGNPPYQLESQGFSAQASTIYHHFVSQAISLNPKYVAMITPSRWFGGGFGLDEFRSRMIADRRLRAIVDNPKVFDCFPGVEIMGGVNYFLWDRDHDGDCEFSTRVGGQIVSTMTRDIRGGDGVLIRDNRAVRIIERVRPSFESASVEAECSPMKHFGVQMMTNYPGSVREPFPGSIPLVYNTHVGFSRTDQIQRNHQDIDRWKVLIPMAYNGGQQVTEDGLVRVAVLGEPIALAPGSACTMSYLVAGMFATREETEHYAEYLATKFVRFLVLQRKNTQHVRADRFRFVPMMDMTREWTDKDLYEHFGLTDDEIEYIEATIKPRSVNLSLDSPIPASHLPGGGKYRPPSEWSKVEAETSGDDE